MLLFCPVIAGAGVAYDFNVQLVDQTNMDFAPAGASPAAVTRYFAGNGKVRIGGAGAKTVYLIEDRTVYAVDDGSRTVRVLKHATLSEVAAHYADAVRQLEEAAAAAAPENRAEAERKASDLKAASDRLLQPVPRQYGLTTRLESVDGHSCRIWEEREGGVKRFEFCVAPTGAVPGGAEVLRAMHALAAFRHGALWALGVDLGLADWWPDVLHLGGVPLEIREFKYDSLIREVTLTAIHPDTPSASLWDLPKEDRVDQGSDFAEW